MIILYFALVIALIFFPLRLAAQFSDAGNTSYRQTFIVALLVAIAQAITLFFLGDIPLLGTLIAIVATVAIGVKLFDIPSSNFLMFGGLFFAMNYAVQIVAGMIIR